MTQESLPPETGDPTADRMIVTIEAWRAREVAAFEAWFTESYGPDALSQRPIERGIARDMSRRAWLARAGKDILALPYHGEPDFDLREVPE